MNNTANQKKILTTVASLRVIAEPNRFKIIGLLKGKPLCVCEIFEALKLPQNLASHHLKVLSDAGILTSIRNGKKIIYSLNKKNAGLLRRELNDILTI